MAGQNENVAVLCADLTESTRVMEFSKKFPNRFIEMGIAEQNMASMAAGLALSGKIPFCVSHAAFNPGQNWNQIRQSVCINKANVKIVGSHSGFSNAKDGATAEPLEDIALMRVLPNTTVLYPIDFDQAIKATLATAEFLGPVYLRLAKDDGARITTHKTPFEIGKAQILSEGTALTLATTGPITYEALDAARALWVRNKIHIEVIAFPTIKPLDEEALIKSAKKTGRVITLEEAQVAGGFGSAVTEVLSEKCVVPVLRLGVHDSFGESGTPKELRDKHGLTAHHIIESVLTWIS